jgi:tRNA1Val (adenine37-N6)-methyltransferase
MANNYFQFKEFIIQQEHCAMKVSTDSCLFGAWVAEKINDEKFILDVGAGTGLLSMILAQKSYAEIDAVEIERACYHQMCENILASPWAGRCKSFNQDIRQYHPNKKYDLILSNPPFYENQLKSDKEGINLARHDDGLQLKDLFNEVMRLLDNDGKFFLLLPSNRKEECIKTALSFKLHPNALTDVKQTPNHKIFRTMYCFTQNEQPITNEVIIIKENDNAYSQRFSALMKDYYLFL